MFKYDGPSEKLLRFKILFVLIEKLKTRHNTHRRWNRKEPLKQLDNEKVPGFVNSGTNQSGSENANKSVNEAVHGGLVRWKSSG